MNRILDITNELGADVKKLSKQAEKAKIYAEKRKELTHLDLTILVKDLKYFKEKLVKVNADLKSSRNELQVFEPDTKSITESLKFSKEKMEVADKNIEVLMQQLTDIIEEINKVELKKASINNKLQGDISSDNLEKKAEAYRQLLETTKFQFTDAKAKAAKLQDEIDAYKDTIDKLTTKRNELAENSSKASIKLAEVRMQIQNIKDAESSKGHMEAGVRTIIENQQSLAGVRGLVKDFLNVKSEYEKAILTALGRSASDIIVETNDDAQTAIDFLKRNKSGKATFLPLESIKARNVKEEHLAVLKTLTGFIDTAANLVEFDQGYANIYYFLLGHVIIADTIESAINLSKYTYQAYRVISLDGDIIAPGGAITGGFNKFNPTLAINLKEKQTQLEAEFSTLDNELIDYRVELDKVTMELNEVTYKQNEKRMLYSRYDESARTNESQLYKYQMDYDQLVKKNNLTDKRGQ
ncbi:hypothetical protein FACS1894166_00980 [Bacilli bacterium]|nr:hypothetical protein FACS1894166_00980 [Bacilli bacterium]